MGPFYSLEFIALQDKVFHDLGYNGCIVVFGNLNVFVGLYLLTYFLDFGLVNIVNASVNW